MRYLFFILSFLLFACTLKPEKLVGTYTGKCDGTPISISLPENGLWQLSKDTIVLFGQNGSVLSNLVTPRDTFIVKKVLFPKKKNCYFTRE